MAEDVESAARPEVAVGAIVVHDERLLLVRRANPPAAGRWAPPGGRVRPGELIAEAVVRELAEETGLEGVCGPLVGVVERIGEDTHFVIHDHAVTLLDPATPPVAGDDAADVAWVPLGDLGDWHCVDGLVDFLHDHGVLDGLRHRIPGT